MPQNDDTMSDTKETHNEPVQQTDPITPHTDHTEGTSESREQKIPETPPEETDKGQNKALWARILKVVKDLEDLNRDALWFHKTELNKVGQDELVVGVPNMVVKHYLDDSYTDTIIRAAEQLLDRSVSVSFEVDKRLFRRMKKQKEQAEEDAARTNPVFDFAPDNREADAEEPFRTLVSTEANRLPMTAAREIALKADSHVHFLMIWGGHGSGKTTLLQTIEEAAQRTGRHSKVLRITGETWLNSYYAAVRSQDTRAFKRRHRTCDFLLVDDLHFLEGKPAAQKELVNTIKVLLDEDARVALTSTGHPDEMDDMHPSLSDYLNEAFWSELKNPSENEKEDVLRQMARHQGLEATDQVLRYITRGRRHTLRDLASTVDSLTAYAHLQGIEKLNMQQATEALSEMSRGRRSRLTLRGISTTAAEVLGVEHDRVLGRSRAKRACRVRHVSMYLAREMTDHSLSEIGRHFGGRSHSTVKHAVDKIRDLQDCGNGVAGDIQAVENRLNRC